MASWFDAATEYAATWLEYQVRHSDLPGLQFAIGMGGRDIVEGAFGKPALSAKDELTSRHLLRVASHSKTFTAAGILKLVDAGRLRLDDPSSAHIAGLHPEIGQATIRQLLTHSGGTTRDGLDAGQWQIRRPFLNEPELRSALAAPPVVPANTRFKYSNHGYGLLGLIIAKITGESYGSWMQREIVQAAGLSRTYVDAPFDEQAPLARGASHRLIGQGRHEIDTSIPTNALAAATGFASTAGDLVRFFRQLSPEAENGWLSIAARREMTRRHWLVPDMSVERHYGLGTMHGNTSGWAWFGHSGVFPGCLSHTAVVPGADVAVSAIVNGVETQPALLVDGVLAILRAIREGGSASPATASWRGRWWTPWAAFDFVPLENKVLVLAPAQANPLIDCLELGEVSETSARIVRAGGFANFGEYARLIKDTSGKPKELWLGGTKLLSENDISREIGERFAKGA